MEAGESGGGTHSTFLVGQVGFCVFGIADRFCFGWVGRGVGKETRRLCVFLLPLDETWARDTPIRGLLTPGLNKFRVPSTKATKALNPSKGALGSLGLGKFGGRTPEASRRQGSRSRSRRTACGSRRRSSAHAAKVWPGFGERWLVAFHLGVSFFRGSLKREGGKGGFA